MVIRVKGHEIIKIIIFQEINFKNLKISNEKVTKKKA